MLQIKEKKDKRMEVRVKSSTLKKINKLRSLYGLSQSELIEELVKISYAEHQKNGKLK